MTRVSKKLIDKEIYNEIFNTLFQTVANLSNKGDVEVFFDEFLSPNERLMFAKRLAVGLLIAEGYDYTTIMNLLKVSTTTVSVYSSYYKYGKGYKKIIDKIRAYKKVRQFLLELVEGISSVGKIGGKGSAGWRELNRQVKKSKSKLLQ